MPYGIANRSGQPDLHAAEEIIKTAWDNSIREFDTAQAYGESETVLGYCLHQLGIAERAHVVTKFSPDLDHLDRKRLSDSLKLSLDRLSCPKLGCIMLHKEAHLDLWNQGLGEILIGFVENGQVDAVGVSVCSPEKALEATKIPGIDCIQIPTNILDQRFENVGVFELAKRKGKQVYIRSIFLQGLLLMEPDQLSPQMSFAHPALEKLKLAAQELNLSRRKLALGYIMSKYSEAKIIFGAETAKQVQANIRISDITFSETIIQRLQKEFRETDERILDPALWPV